MSFCPNLKNKQVKQEFEELVDIFGEDVAYLLWNKNNGYSLDTAPNGEPSKLYSVQLEQTGERKLALINSAKIILNSQRRFDKKLSKLEIEKEFSRRKTAAINLIIDNKLAYWKNKKLKASFQSNQIYKEQQVEQIAKFYGLSHKYNPKDGSMFFVDNTSTKQNIEDLQNFLLHGNNSSIVNYNSIVQFIESQIGLNDTIMGPLLDIIKQTIGDRNIVLKIVDNLEDGVSAKYSYDGTGESKLSHTITLSRNAVYQDFLKNSGNISQSLMHELIHAITVDALINNSKLRDQLESIRSQFIKYNKSFKYNYANKNIYEFIAELSNPSLVRAMQQAPYRKTTLGKESILDAIKRIFKDIFDSIFGNIVSKYRIKDTLYKQALQVFMSSTIDMSQSGEEVYNYSRDNVYTEFNIQNSNKKLNEIQKDLIEQHTRLYTEYKKRFSKTPEQQRRQDILWNTIQKLRVQESNEAVDYAIQQALQITGTYIVNPITQQPNNSPRSTILGFLQEEQQNNFANLTPELIQDMQQTIISFYNDMYNSMFKNEKDLNFETQARLRDLGTALKYINGLWVEAANTVGDRIVDQLIDRYISKSEKEKDNMKQVAKDWLHKNEMYGDTAWLENMIRYSRQNSPIIKQAFQLMQDANQKTQKESQEVQSKIIKMFMSANSLVDDLSLGNWQTDLMERYTKGKKKGQFTGNFKSAVNRGQFKQDLEDFINNLIKEFDDKYGYHYITDKITGQVSRSDSEQSIEEEEWNNGVAPTYIEWRKKIENWLCDHAERRYTKEYYNEMLSVPYDYKAKTGHGLSPKTISRQRYIQDQINYLLQKCTDNKTHLAHPENLAREDKIKLKMWKDALSDLSNPFTVDGELKQGEDFQIAVELQAWNKFIRDNTDYDTDTEQFDKDYDKLQDEVNKGIRPYSDLLDFVDENSVFDIDPDYLEYAIGKTNSDKDQIIAMYQSSIKNLVKTKNGFRKDMSNIIFTRYTNSQFGDVLKVTDAIKCYRDSDVKNEEKAQQLGKKGSSINKYLQIKLIPYTDSTGKYISRVDGKTYDPKDLELDDAITWYEYILDKYTDAAMDGRMPEYKSNDGSIYVQFSSFNGDRDAVREFIDDNILSYNHSYTDRYGMQRIEKRALSIFLRLYPVEETFENGKPTTRNVPKGRYTNKSNKGGIQLYNDNFFKEEGTQMQPKFDLYGDSDFVKQIQKGDKKAQYYKYLIDVMQQCWNELGLDASYNKYRLPQIEGTGMQKFSRSYKNPGQYIKNKIQNAFGVTSDDTNERQSEDYIMQNGKWVLNSIATRYINDLEDTNQISSDLAYTVGQFYRMTKNYLNKKAVQPYLETLGYNLQGENRDTKYATTGTRQYDIYQKMLKQLLYESNMTNQTQGKMPSKTLIAAQKAANSLRSLAAIQKLGLNIPSMLTGVWDSLTQIPSIAARGDQFTIKKLIKSMIMTFPNLFKAFANIGNPIANCKSVAMMQKDQLVRDNKHTYSKGYKNRLTKAISESIMGGYTLGDYMTNMLLQRSIYESKKYYPGYSVNGKYIVKPGFYIKNSLIRTLIDSGLSKKEAEAEANYPGESLWDAYEFKNGLAVLKDKYKQLEKDLGKPLDSQESATIKQTAALVNGNNPDNDNSSVSNNLMYKFFFFLRNYITSRAEHWFAGWKPDNIVREKEEIIGNQVRGSNVMSNKKVRWKNLTDEQKATRGNYDYSTGEFQPALFINLIRGARSQMRAIKNVLLGMIGKQKSDNIFNPNEVRAIKEVLMYGMLLSALTIGWMMFHGWAYEETKDLKPDDLQGSVPSVDNFMKQKVYLKLIDNVMLRTIDSQAQLLNPIQVVDMVRNATSVMSAIDDWSAPTAAMLDLTGISGHDLDEEITSDSRFKYYTRWQRAAITSFGPLNNLQKWTSWRGNDKVERWFFDNTITGTGLKTSGVSWKNEDSNNLFQNIGDNIGEQNRINSMNPKQRNEYFRIKELEQNQKIRETATKNRIERIKEKQAAREEKMKAKRKNV